MAINGLIPQSKMPIDTFNTQFEQLMQQIARNRQIQNQQKQLEETAKYHKGDLDLRRQAGSRAERQMDPKYKLDQLKAMIEGLKSMYGGGEQQQGEEQSQPGGMAAPEGMPNMPPMGQGNAGVPGVSAEGPGVIPEGQSPFVGRAGYKPPQQQPAQQGNMNQEIAPGIMLEDIVRHAMGLPARKAPVETPEQKRVEQLKLFKEKEAFKAHQEAKQPAAIKTLHENIIHMSPRAIESIEHLIKIPSPSEPWGFGAIKSGQKAAHNAAVSAAAETYAKAKGWPNTKGSIAEAKTILQRHSFETDHDYRERLRGYIGELKEGVKTSTQFLHPNSQSDNANSDPLGLGI